jgi:hypothetical protein
VYLLKEKIILCSLDNEGGRRTKNDPGTVVARRRVSRREKIEGSTSFVFEISR